MLSMSVQFDERISVSKILERNDVMSQTSLTPDHVHKYTNIKAKVIRTNINCIIAPCVVQ